MWQNSSLSSAGFFALGETPERIELFDGSLTTAPPRTPRHQHISGELALALRSAARDAGVHIHEAVNVRLRPDRIAIPDLVVTKRVNLDDLVIEAEAVRLVCEIISPSSASTDRVLKMRYYAAAGIPWYLLVDQATGTLHLYELDAEHSVTKPGEVLHLTDPLDAILTPEELLPPV